MAAELSLFEKILHTNIINVSIMVSCLVLIFKKAKLGEKIENAANNVRLKIEQSKQSVQDSIADYQKAQKSVGDLETLKEQIINDNKLNTKNLKEKLEEKGKFKQEEIISKTKKTGEAIAKKTQGTIVDNIYHSCVDMAKNEVISMLNDDTHRYLIHKSIEQIDNLDGTKI